MHDATPIRTLEGIDRRSFVAEIRDGAEPVVMKGVVAHWPIVRAARESVDELAQVIRRLDAGREPTVIEADPGARGHIFYADDLSGFNFERRPLRIREVVDRLLAVAAQPEPPAIFIESMPASSFTPDFACSHVMPLLDAAVEPRLWIGNAVKVNTHFDLACNIACVAGGRRRFTLFPPDQIENLYVAPFDFTPSGAPVSLAQLTLPDFARFPRLLQALEHARVAELGPGDALFIPYGWWHHVESLTPFNVLVNYWWNDAHSAPAPHGALLHALLAIRDLPAAQREVWASLFRHLVFTDPERALAHLPRQVRGMFAPPSPQRTRAIKTQLLRDLQENP